MFQRFIELVYTAYMVPALMVPVAWLLLRYARRRGRLATAPGRELLRLELGIGAVAAGWIVLWLLMKAGVPIGVGMPQLVVGTVLFLSLNAALAWLLVRFTAGYGALPQGPAADRLFLGFVGLFAVHPLVTGAALGIMHHVMGLAWQASMPQFIPGQEGI